MSGRWQREDTLILAISHWSQKPWETPPLFVGLRRLVVGGPAGERPDLDFASSGLRDVIEQSLVRPSLSDIAPRLVGLDIPLYLAPLRASAAGGA